MSERVDRRFSMVSRTLSNSRALDASGLAVTMPHRTYSMSSVDLMTEQQRYYHDLLSSEAGRLSEEPRRLHSAGVQQRRALEDCVAGHSDVYLKSVDVKKELGAFEDRSGP